MNVPAIRAALERLKWELDRYEGASDVEAAVVRAGLRACDEAAYPLQQRQRELNISTGSALAMRADAVSRLAVIVDILREAGVEVGE